MPASRPLRVLTLLGTRPEIIRLSRVIPRLDQLLGRENHLVVHTGQNSDPTLSANFFAELGLRSPDCNLMVSGTFGEQTGAIFPRIERVLAANRPDRFLVLGDTNSALAAIVAARLGIPVYHMEAGNRSYSPSSPEEVNRRLVDHACAASGGVLLPYTERSRSNLLREGIHSASIFVTGNPIWEVIDHYRDRWERSDVLARLGVESGKFFLVTLHRAENVDPPARLIQFLRALTMIQRECGMSVIVSTHPRVHKRLEGMPAYGVELDPAVRFLPPFPFFDFLQLQSHSLAVLTDSGTVQEESCLLRRPCVVLRDYTERPETQEAGATILAGADPERILAAARQATRMEDDPAMLGRAAWTPPADYLRLNVADTVCRILLGHLPNHERTSL